MALGGYRGKLLEVDLTRSEVRTVPLPGPEVLRRWVGCTGLGLHMLAQEITPDMQPTDPECPVFIMTGPLTGSLAPSAANWTIVSLNGNIPYHVGICQSHGYWGARLKHAGWDGIIIRGASPKPVYLWVDNDKVEIRDASRYWGQDTFETTRQIQVAHQDPENISVACIGPGGENLLPGGSVRSDLAYGASKGGLGLIWGAKKLKAIAVRGTGTVPMADHEAFVELCERWKQALTKSARPPATRGAEGLLLMPEYGTSGRANGKNCTDPETAVEWGKRLGAAIPQWKVKPVGSWQCEMECHAQVDITTGPMSGCSVIGYIGSVIESVGPNLGITEPGVSVALSGALDGLGLDCAEIPSVIALLMEAYSKGRITREDTDGLDLSWGNYEAVMEVLNKVVAREGVGALIAKGIRATARELGIEDLAVHIKGTGYVEHDPRIRGIAIVFGYIMSGAGPTRQVALSTNLPDLGYDQVDANDPAGKGKYISRSHAIKMWQDCLGVCVFACDSALKGMLETTVEGLGLAVGWPDFTSEEALLVGERIANLLRLMSLYRGYKPEYDFDFSPKLVAPVPNGPAKGQVGIGSHFAEMRDEYYQSLGWDLRTGVPTHKTLKRVGLAEYRVGRV